MRQIKIISGSDISDDFFGPSNSEFEEPVNQFLKEIVQNGHQIVRIFYITGSHGSIISVIIEYEVINNEQNESVSEICTSKTYQS